MRTASLERTVYNTGNRHILLCTNGGLWVPTRSSGKDGQSLLARVLLALTHSACLMQQAAGVLTMQYAFVFAGLKMCMYASVSMCVYVYTFMYVCASYLNVYVGVLCCQCTFANNPVLSYQTKLWT